jgi:CubicO group peptidase (beta-lactamase class C family)
VINHIPRRGETNINLVLIAGLVTLASLLTGLPTHAAKVPPGVADPDIAIHDPQYSDPVFWWRMSSMPKDVFEPDPYFYWPPALISGSNGPFLDAATPGQGSIDPAALDAAAKWAEANKSTALIVIQKGKVVLETYWGGAKPDELASGRALTRGVTPLLLGFPVADGQLKLDDPIGRYIHEWKDDPRGRITVRQLAQNESGLEVAPPSSATHVPGNKDLYLAYGGDVIRAALAYEQTSKPGSRFDVAQENTQLLALVIERATGQPIQTLFSERVWKKIGAADAAFQFDRPGGVARVMCCMRATPRDWARLAWLIEQGGVWNGEQVIPAGWIKTMATPAGHNPNFGMGLWLGSPYNANRSYFEGQPGVIAQSEPFLADDVVMMEGGGNREIWVSPSKDLAVLRLGTQVKGWDNSVLMNTLIRGIRP